MTEYPPTPTVHVDHLRKAFGSVLAVADVAFEVFPGEIFGLLGPNGAGKTTTIRMMLDIFRPDAGHVAIFGGPMNERKKNLIGYMPEERGLYRDLKLEPTLIYLATLKGLDQATVRRRLPDKLSGMFCRSFKLKVFLSSSQGDSTLKTATIYSGRENKTSKCSGRSSLVVVMPISATPFNNCCVCSVAIASYIS